MSLDLARGPDFSSACQKGPLGTRLISAVLLTLAKELTVIF